MDDQELRDKLASEAIKNWVTINNQSPHRPDVLEHAWKLGWDAARENAKELVEAAAGNICGYCWDKMHEGKLDELEKERDQLRAELSKCKAEYAAYVSGRPGEWYVTQLQKERDQLKSELEKAKQFDLTAAVLAKDVTLTEECDQLRAAAEKLAEALDKCMWVDSERGNITGIARQALAKYRAQYPKENK